VNTPELTPALARAVGGRPWQMRLAGDHAEQLRDPRPSACRWRFTERQAHRGRRRHRQSGALLHDAEARRPAGRELPLPDHHDFLDDPFRGLDADLILITEKDAVKCRQLEHLNNDPRLWVVPVAAQIDAALAAYIVEKCRGRPTA
jgi:tetraacyldisaccharide 4'-kinase